MKVYTTVPAGSLDGWRESPEELPGPQTIGPHYHDVEEWLTVINGEITFFTLAGEPFRVDITQSLHILRGEVHRVEVGSQGVEYRMFVPIVVSTFANALEDEEVEALRCNLEFPEYEDGCPENGRQFFKSALSEKLVFCRANGKCEGRQEFLAGLPGDGNRSSSGSIQVLNKTGDGLLISTVVQVGNAEQTKWYVMSDSSKKTAKERFNAGSG